MDENKKIRIEAAAFRRLMQHLRTHSEVQNIDLMNLADFCRNCLSKWYLSAAEKRKINLDYNKSRELIYGMPYEEWKNKYQKEVSKEKLEKYKNK